MGVYWQRQSFYHGRLNEIGNTVYTSLLSKIIIIAISKKTLLSLMQMEFSYNYNMSATAYKYNYSHAIMFP